MPKKINFLGGQQNYNADNGQYLPELKGPNGESPSGFQSFKKPKSEFEKNNEKRLGKKKGNDEEKEEYKDVTDDEISEVLADYDWQITPETTAGQYAEACAKHLGTSKEKVFNVIKQQAPDKITEDSKMADLMEEWEKVEDDDSKQLEKAIKNADKEVLDEQFGKDTPEGKLVSAMKGSEKEKSLDEYTDELFKETKIKTFDSKKYKTKEGDIVEIRRFGNNSAIRYNETKKQIEQVWLKGKKVK